MLSQLNPFWIRLHGYAPLFIRVVLGVIFIAHGADKLFNAFGGGGFEATAHQFESLGLHPGWFHAALGGGGELVGGILVLTGFMTRLGGFLLAATMVVAILTVHLHNGLFARDNGFEYPLALLGASLSLIASGGGKWALDAYCCKLHVE